LFQHIDISTVKVLLGFSALAGAFLTWLSTVPRKIPKLPLIFIIVSTTCFWMATLILLIALILCPLIFWINDLGFIFVLLGAIFATLSLEDPLRTLLDLMFHRTYHWRIKKELGW